MAKNTNKRSAHMQKNNRNVEFATSLLTVGFISELYILNVAKFLVRGSVKQVVAAASFLQIMTYVGIALVGAGIALLFLHRKNGEKFGSIKWWALLLGVFITLSSELMYKLAALGTTALSVFVPVVTVLGIIFLMYPREFSAQAIALAGTIAAMALTKKSLATGTWTVQVKIFAALVLVAIAAISFVTVKAKGNHGAFGSVQIYGASTNYKMLCIVMCLCVAAIVIVLAVSSLAYYGLWVMSAVAFLLAVYYTVKMM